MRVIERGLKVTTTWYYDGRSLRGTAYDGKQNH
jgi:hypothetical protein